MKNYFILLFLLFSLMVESQNYKVMTYNIRLDVASDGENTWNLRKDHVAGLLQFYQPDILGIQEGLPHQVHYLDSLLIGYQVIGQGRDGGKKGEQSAIFYNHQTFDVLESDTFWLSETPEKVSKGWDAQLNRICTYGLFKNKITKEVFWVFNTHLDHVGAVAREKSAQLIHQMIESKNSKKYPVVVMGDLNSEPITNQVMFLSEKYLNAKKEAALVYNATGTFNGFDFFKPVTTEIDYIFLSKEKITIQKYAVLTDSYNCKYPSDHFPVLVEFQFTK
jgi:endonuclease/exonuclease/phosphatase family metal-dependent hydrolase